MSSSRVCSADQPAIPEGRMDDTEGCVSSAARAGQEVRAGFGTVLNIPGTSRLLASAVIARMPQGIISLATLLLGVVRIVSEGRARRRRSVRADCRGALAGLSDRPSDA